MNTYVMAENTATDTLSVVASFKNVTDARIFADEMNRLTPGILNYKIFEQL